MATTIERSVGHDRPVKAGFGHARDLSKGA
jgi:hypothetical protein